MLRKLSIAFFTLSLTISGLQDSFAQTRKVYSYYDNLEKHVKEAFTLRSGAEKILQGPYTAYYENGVKKIEGNYVNNIPHGDWIFYYPSGRVRMKGKVINGKNNGPWEYFYEDGSISMKGNLHQNNRVGRWRTYFPNGTIKSDGVYKEGAKDGNWRYYNKVGAKYAEAEYVDGKGTYREFYPSGSVKMSGKVNEGVRTGEWEFYYEDGNIKSKGAFVDGKQHDTWKFFNPMGDLISEGPFLNGKEHGLWTQYHDNGNVKAQGDILNGQRNGDWKMFFEDGTVRGEANFILGTGDYIEYYKSGKLKVKGRVVNGKNHGKWEYYYENGKLEGDCVFDNGSGNYVGYYTSGKVKMRGKIRDDKKVGIWELYNQDETLAGYYKPYYERGNTTFWRANDSEQQRRLTATRGRKAGSYKYKAKRNRFFKPRVNEFRAVIIGYNPVAPIFNSIPLGIEYYMQQRLGYELLLNYIRAPFFRNHGGLDNGELYETGYSVALRQKFYTEEKRYGIPYFGHELRYTNLQHGTNVADPNDEFTSFEVTQSENKYEYSIFIGNRFWKSSNEGGFTVDAYLGAGLGYRDKHGDYASNPDYDQLFEDLSDSKLSYAIRFGVNLGIGIRANRR